METNMNERIKKLIEECTFIYDDLVYDGTDSYMKTSEYFDKEKFAELIVKECLDIADGQKKWVEDMKVFNEQDANWNKARIQQSQRIVDKIKEHFGVKE
jgi:hypothetical protein